MAQRTRRTRRPTTTQEGQSSDVRISVPVPQASSITVNNLKSLSEKDFNDLLEKPKTARVGFIILNAPFKVRPTEPVA